MKRIVFIFLLFCTAFTLFINIDDEIRVLNNDNNLVYDEVLKQVDNDIVGHIKIEGTNINTYIVQGEDNFYYLNHNYKKVDDINGSAFLDYRNKISDKKLLIYGHNSKELDYALFKDLEKYKDSDFYNKHKYIDVLLGDKNYIYEIFSVKVALEGDYQHTMIKFVSNSYLEHLKFLKEESLYDTDVDVVEDDYIITMQTCNYSPENSYLLVNARRLL